MDGDVNPVAGELIAQGRLGEARALLEAAIRDMPPRWTPRREEGGRVAIAFWDREEFLAYRARHTDEAKSLLWAADSYSKAWYQLAAVAIEQKDYERALACLDRGLDLEPDHPELWCEKGYALGRLKRYEEALACYARAESCRDWAPSCYAARALRGQGSALIELDRLDEAQGVLERSLELEPDSKAARNELQYIDDLKRRRQEAAGRLPWFVEAFVHPPQDPMTLRLMEMVEDLAPIPGPETVGAGNYSRILDAFMKKGWAGFEEAFDGLVPRERPDYAVIKRELLREPVFKRKVQRRLTEVFTGKKSVEDVFGAMEGEHGRGPR